MAGEVAVARSARASSPSLTTVRRTGGRVLLYILAIATSLMFMAPFFWTVSSSLKHVTEIFLFPPTWLPEVPQWDNYAEVWRRVPFATFTLNTIIITVLSVTGMLLTSSIVAYSFARFRYPGRDIFFLITLGTMMLPYEVTLIPTYLLFNRLGWLDTFLPLIVPYWFGGNAFSIFLMRQFFMTIPRELDDAARIDGANFIRIFWNILMPLSGPALATLAVIGFIANWNDFLGPLIFLESRSNFTIALGLRYFQNVAGLGGEPMHHLLMAASVTFTIPCIVIFFVAQRYFVQGIALSGVKG
jgi:ABC-type glycerol-3-phosphate transport system permease component